MMKFVKVLEAPDFTFWHFEIIYDKNDRKEVGKWKRMK